MTKHCKFPADQNWQCQKPSHRFLRFPITHWSTHKPHNSNSLIPSKAHILQITCFFLGLWNENKVSQTKILQDYIKYRQKYRPVPPLGLLVDPPIVSISKFHVTSFSGYHIYKIFRKPDLTSDVGLEVEFTNIWTPRSLIDPPMVSISKCYML